MVNVFNIIVTSAMLVLGNDVNNPVPYCTVQLQQPATQEPQPRRFAARPLPVPRHQPRRPPACRRPQ